VICNRNCQNFFQKFSSLVLLLDSFSSGSPAPSDASVAVPLAKRQFCGPAELVRHSLKAGVFCALDYLFLQLAAEVAEIVAVAGHPNYQTAVGLWLVLRFL